MEDHMNKLFLKTAVLVFAVGLNTANALNLRDVSIKCATTVAGVGLLLTAYASNLIANDLMAPVANASKAVVQTTVNNPIKPTSNPTLDTMAKMGEGALVGASAVSYASSKTGYIACKFLALLSSISGGYLLYRTFAHK